ncbi:MAG: hypothetical protein A3J62_01470 [Candidatus Buchananbacteria bacterium RIFCSPHIGHO2_02_FULL_38_8]|uniref:Acid phosphatase n=1 Tax=Candidatus Buchananbacteria bacterium RIFCSPHIGHO2_02_FULL_38_8 TaxID=1797538 RepID=A0A1G1Y7Z2_9BACT|nr:MAG: hypothetical protein A3J62_01470 [Candidatus Buchananbacteria bacterium RIFCSPHIGHO2_02_FULL_38_8]
MDYSYIIIPIIVLITSQALKLATDGIRGNFDLQHLFISYGGFPSAHTAFSVSITTLVGLRFGIDAPLFAITLVFTLLVMRDAVAFRNIMGKQARVCNSLRETLPESKKNNIPRLRERMGHSLLEVSAGAVWGIAITYFLNLL